MIAALRRVARFHVISARRAHQTSISLQIGSAMNHVNSTHNSSTPSSLKKAS